MGENERKGSVSTWGQIMEKKKTQPGGGDLKGDN